MYIYNLTINVAEEIHHEWLRWMKNEHIADIIIAGKFNKALMTRVLAVEEMGGITYSVQFTANSREQIRRYLKEEAKAINEKASKFKGQYVTFSTELKIILEY